jgi:ribosomal protein L22
MTKTTTALRPTARVSLKDAVKIFRNIRNKNAEKVKNLLNDLINQKRNIEGKYYTGASKEILSLIEEAENNADSLGLDREKLFVKEAVVSKALTYMLPKSRWSHRGRKAKICQLKITLGER